MVYAPCAYVRYDICQISQYFIYTVPVSTRDARDRPSACMIESDAASSVCHPTEIENRYRTAAAGKLSHNHDPTCYPRVSQRAPLRDSVAITEHVNCGAGMEHQQIRALDVVALGCSASAAPGEGGRLVVGAHQCAICNGTVVESHEAACSATECQNECIAHVPRGRVALRRATLRERMVVDTGTDERWRPQPPKGGRTSLAEDQRGLPFVGATKAAMACSGASAPSA